MKTKIIAAAIAALSIASMRAETITLGDTEYNMTYLIDREVGPGMRYTRLRLPDYPLNVNLLRVDLSNPYNRVETSVGKEKSRGTELLVEAAARQTYEGHRAIAGANANFWYVGTQTQGPTFTGISIGASVRNGKIITETNQHRDQFDYGSMSTGIVALDFDKLLHIAPCTSTIKITSSHFGPTEVHQCNKGVWEDELSMYNSHYGADTPFMPLGTNPSDNNRYCVAQGLTDVTEVILDFDGDASWVSATDIPFVVKEVRTMTNGQGTLGEHDLALVGRGDNSVLLSKLAAGEKITLNYSWTFEPGTDKEVTPKIDNAVGGNAIVMLDGELRQENYIHGYCNMVYSRTGYGCSKDGKTLYIIVIDKSTDPVYGSSTGCTTDVMCLLAKHFGCSNMANLDAGGSAQMYLNGSIINKTTEGSPRQVNNGWMIYSIAPEGDTDVARIAFYDCTLRQATGTSASPAIIAYNKYGDVISYDYKDVVYTVSEGAGSCTENEFVAGNTPCTGILTATCGDVSVSKEIEIIPTESVAMYTSSIIIDNMRPYPVGVTATAAGNTYMYNPAHIDWTVDDSSIARIDDDGVLHGIANGSTHITGVIDGATVEADVKVEIPEAREMPICAISDWTAKGSTGLKVSTIAENGHMTWNLGSRTSGSIDFSNGKLPLYSLPDELFTEFNSDARVESLTIDLQAANNARATSFKITPEEPFAAGETHRIEFGLGDVFDLSDIAVFPITFTRMRLIFEKQSANAGERTLEFGGVHAIYEGVEGVNDITIGETVDHHLSLMPNPASSGTSVVVCAPGITSIDVYTLAGSLVSSHTSDGSPRALITAPSAGSYVVCATTASGPRSAILIVK